jgi:hypothetical protein
MNRLTFLEASRLSKPGMYGDGEGLYLLVGKTTKSWIFRYSKDGKAHEMGLGSFRVRSLAQAREKAREFKKLLVDGIDPLSHKRAKRTETVVRKHDGGEIAMTSRPLSTADLLGLSMPRLATGIYFLFQTNILQYVGQSMDCHARVNKHKQSKIIPFDQWRFIPVLPCDLDCVEALYIRAHAPPYNKGIRRPQARTNQGLPLRSSL